METSRTFSGARLRAIRQGRGLTIEQFARVLEMNIGNISRWERDQHIPGANQVAALADRLGVPLDEFYENGKAA